MLEDLRTNPNAVGAAEQSAEPNRVTVCIPINPGKCIPSYVQSVVTTPWCHFDHAVTGPFIAVIASAKLRPRQQNSDLELAPFC